MHPSRKLKSPSTGLPKSLLCLCTALPSPRGTDTLYPPWDSKLLQGRGHEPKNKHDD